LKKKFWSLGAKTEWSGMSRSDAMLEAARRSTLPELWCVVPNKDPRTNSQEPYTVNPFDGLSHSERDDARATSDSEQAAWQAIAGIVEKDRQQTAAYEQERREWAKTESRNEGARRVLGTAAMIILVVGAVWLTVTVVHWFWVHPLF
jgi:hypothetical protein